MKRAHHNCTHGHSAGRRSRAYVCWSQMIERCRDTNHPGYHRYGGRGIRVCRRWRSFTNFFADMGNPPRGKSLGRVHNSKGYDPDNCEWQTPRQQANNRRGNRLLTFKGRRLTVAEWSRVIGIPQIRIRSRLHRGLPIGKALSRKILPNHPAKHG